MILSIELDHEEDGRWIAEAMELPGVMSYGATREEAISNTEKMAIEAIADRIEHGELLPVKSAPGWFLVSPEPTSTLPARETTDSNSVQIYYNK